MPELNANQLYINQQMLDALQKELSRSDVSDDAVIRVKLNNGKYEFRSDGGAQGSKFGRTFRAGQLAEKGANNVASAHALLLTYAEDGKINRAVDQEKAELMLETAKAAQKSLKDRNIKALPNQQPQTGLTRKDAKLLIEQGQARAALSQAPHSTAPEVRDNLEKYLAQGAFGITTLLEHLADIDFSVKDNADALRDLSVGLQSHQLDAFPDTKAALTSRWIDVRAESILQGEKTLGQKLDAGEKRLKGYRFKGSPQSKKPDTRLEPTVIAKVVTTTVEKSNDTGAKSVVANFETVTTENPELANNPVFKASYYQYMLMALEGGAINEGLLDRQSGLYDDVQPRVYEAALHEAGIEKHSEAAGRLRRVIQFTNLPTQLAPGDTRLPFEKTAQKAIVSSQNAIRINGEQVNASRVHSNSGVNMIATQAPRDGATADTFFKVVMQENIDTIVNLTRPGEAKLLPYIPTQPGESVTVGNTTLTLVSEKGGRSVVNLQTPDGDRQITIVHIKNWPDHGAMKPNELHDAVYSAKKAQPKNMLTHCNAGMGRTGTFCTAYDLTTMADNGQLTTDEGIEQEANDLCTTNRMLRGSGWVQTVSQHELVFKTAQLSNMYGTVNK